MRSRMTRAAGILLVALLGVSGSGALTSATPVGAEAPVALAAPSIAITAQPYGYTIYVAGEQHFIQQGLKLHVTGSSFAPGSILKMALINTANLKVLARFRTYSEPATTVTLCAWGHNACSAPNPLAGKVDTTVRLEGAWDASDLRLLYRAPHITGMGEIAPAQ